MIEFTMNSKKLKEIIMEAKSLINISSIKNLMLKITKEGILEVFVTDLEQYLIIKEKDCWNVSEGSILLNINDLKIIEKISNNITLKELDKKIIILSGNKTITFPTCNSNDFVEFPMLKEEVHVLTIKESWFADSILNMEKFTLNEDFNSVFKCFNFNIKEKRLEALNEKRVAIKSLNEQTIITNDISSFLLNNNCVSSFKKLLNKKSELEIKIYYCKNHIKITGNNFIYIQKRIEGNYSNLNILLQSNHEFSFTVNKKKLLDIIKYNYEILKNNKDRFILIIFHNYEGKLYTYLNSDNYEFYDYIETKELNMQKELYIKFNSENIMEGISLIDTEDVIIKGTTELSPITIDGNEYTALVLPYKISLEEKEQMDKCIKQHV